MPVYKDKKTNTWYVKNRTVDWTGKTKHVMKRGFSLKREALEWEDEYFNKQANSVDMTFETFYNVYKEDMGARLKDSTWETKSNIVEIHILPFFKELRMCDITSLEVMRWQNEMMKLKTSSGAPYSQVYLKTLHNQLSAIFNHVVRHYKLSENPARTAGAIGQATAGEMNIWTKQEYLRFAEAVMDKPLSYYCFEMLYWCGIREGELLALTPQDFNFKKKEVSITKTYYRSHGKDVVTDPKTKESVRVVSMPPFLCEEMQEFLASCYKPKPTDRIFLATKHFLYHEMVRGAAAAGVKKIRVHDLRHSHVSLLINMGYSAVAIAKRVGHKSIDITYRYAHLFPSVQKDMADDLEKVREEAEQNDQE